MDQSVGKLIILIGFSLILAGIVIYFFHDKLHFLGHLPGDIRIKKPGFQFYFPITTMLLFSAVISLVFYLIRMILSR